MLAHRAVRTLPQRVRSVLRKYGSDAHLYLFGPGGNLVRGFQPGNYFDSAGTTLASVDGSVGLVLDAAGSVGAELSTVQDITIAGQNNYVSSSPALVVGKTYKVSYSYNLTAGAIQLSLGGVGLAANNGPSSGNVSQYIVATSTEVAHMYANAASAGLVAGLTVREVTGIHATQSTPGYKPTLRKGIVNLLTWSNDLTNAAWSGAVINLTSSNVSSGGIAAYKLTPTVSSGVHRLNRGIPVVNGSKYTGAVLVKAGGYNYFGLKSGIVGADQPVFDLANGAVVQGVGSIASVGNGWYLCCHNVTGSSDNFYITYWTVLASSDFAAETFAGDGTAGCYFASGAVFQGTLTAAQILAAGGIPLTTTAPASSVAGVNYLEFDGVDDHLSLSFTQFQVTDNHCVVVAAKAPVNIAQYRSIASLSHYDNSNYSAQILIEGGTGKAYVEWKGGGNVDFIATPSSVIGSAFVFSARSISGTKDARLNGVSCGTRGAVLSSLPATSAYIGVTNSVGHNPMKGNIHCVLAIKGTVSDADLAVLEKFVAQLSGVQL